MARPGLVRSFPIVAAATAAGLCAALGAVAVFGTPLAGSQAALYYLWFAFLMTYLPRVRGVLPGAGGAPWTFGVFLALVVVLPFLRLAARLRPAAGLPVLASR